MWTVTWLLTMTPQGTTERNQVIIFCMFSLCSLHYDDGDVSVDDDVTRYYRADSGKMILCMFSLCSLHYVDGDVSVDDDVTRYYRADSGEIQFVFTSFSLLLNRFNFLSFFLSFFLFPQKRLSEG